MCMDNATAVAFGGLQQQVAHLEQLLKQHEDASQLRSNQVCAMVGALVACLPLELPDTWVGTVRLPWFGRVTITLRPVKTPPIQPAPHSTIGGR